MAPGGEAGFEAQAGAGSFEDRIEYRDVSFAYEDASGPVLHEISFTVRKGEVLFRVDPRPFQFEVGTASLGFAAVGLLAAFRSYDMRLAAVLGPRYNTIRGDPSDRKSVG